MHVRSSRENPRKIGTYIPNNGIFLALEETLLKGHSSVKDKPKTGGAFYGLYFGNLLQMASSNFIPFWVTKHVLLFFFCTSMTIF